MAKALSEKEQIEKEMDRLKKKIDSLNKAISFQANKIGNTNVPLIIAREEKVLKDHIKRKKQALENLKQLKQKKLEADKNYNAD